MTRRTKPWRRLERCEEGGGVTTSLSRVPSRSSRRCSCPGMPLQVEFDVSLVTSVLPAAERRLRRRDAPIDSVRLAALPGRVRSEPQRGHSLYSTPDPSTLCSLHKAPYLSILLLNLSCPPFRSLILCVVVRSAGGDAWIAGSAAPARRQYRVVADEMTIGGSVLDALRAWFDAHESSLADDGYQVEFAESPVGRDKLSASVTVASARRIARLVIWDTGEAELSMGDVASSAASHTATLPRSPDGARDRTAGGLASGSSHHHGALIRCGAGPFRVGRGETHHGALGYHGTRSIT